MRTQPQVSRDFCPYAAWMDDALRFAGRSPGVAGEGRTEVPTVRVPTAKQMQRPAEKRCTEKRERGRERERERESEREREREREEGGREETAGRRAGDRHAGFYLVFIRGRVKAICIFNSGRAWALCRHITAQSASISVNLRPAVPLVASAGSNGISGCADRYACNHFAARLSSGPR